MVGVLWPWSRRFLLSNIKYTCLSCQFAAGSGWSFFLLVFLPAAEFCFLTQDCLYGHVLFPVCCDVLFPDSRPPVHCGFPNSGQPVCCDVLFPDFRPVVSCDSMFLASGQPVSCESSFQTLVCLSSVMSSFQTPVRKSAATCFPYFGSSVCCAFPDSGQYVCCYVRFSDSDLLSAPMYCFQTLFRLSAVHF